MALVNVQASLVSAISAALYPAGTSAPSAVGTPVRAYAGWPVSNALDASISAGSVDVSVFPRPGMSKNSTRYPLTWQQLSATQPTLTATATGNTVTLGGTGGIQQLVGIQVAGVPYVYAATASDTPATAAAALAALIPGATVSGAAITVPAGPITTAVGGYAVGNLEVRRESQELQVSIWAPTPALRDAVSACLDVALAQLPWLQLADGTTARLLYRGQTTVDAGQKSAIWRRDILFGVEFGISVQQQYADLLFPSANISAAI